jgi:hypothetical protein
MSDRDPYTNPDDQSAIPDASDPSAPVRNRPAAGAPQLETTSEIDLDWQGNTGATDFLGLDGDLRDKGGSASPIEGFAGRAATGEGPVLDSWLMEIEGQTEAPAPSAEAAEAATRLLDEGETDPEAPDAGEPPQPVAQPSRVLQLVALAAVLLLAAGGAWYLQQRKANPSNPTQVATRPAPKNTPKPKIPTPKPGNTASTTTPTGDPATDPTTNATSVPVAPSTDPLATDPTPPIEAPVANSTPPTLVTTTPTDPNADLPPPTLALPPAPVVPVPPTAVEPVHPAPGTLNPRGALHVKVDTSGKVMPGSVRRATEADFSDLWRETRIPTELFNSEHRIRTLSVGRVKALVIGGEYFEGNLYAVGQGHIWLDVDLGRISLEATTVKELTQVAVVKATAGANKGKVDELAGLPHVEVRLPGGSVTGRLVGQDGNRVTLVTDQGMRATVDSDDVRPLTSRNTRVVGSLKDIEKKQN